MSKRRFLNFIIVSLTFHVVLTLVLFLFSRNQKPLEKSVEVVILEKPTEILKPKPKDLLTEKSKTPPGLPSRIVETDENFANNKKDDNARFLSAKNNTVEKETRAKTGEQFKNVLKHGAKTVDSAKSDKKEKTTATKSTPDLFAKDFDPYAKLQAKQEAFEQKKADVAKAAETGAEKGEQSSTNDHLENVGEDLVTKLNTKEFKYYGYYQRIKSQLNQWWGPKVRERVVRMFKKGRMLASEGNKTTKLVIVLNDVGTLVRVQVLGESGIRDLDEAAIDAFRAAAPFPNPPKGIVDADGTVKIRWDFVIEL